MRRVPRLTRVIGHEDRRGRYRFRMWQGIVLVLAWLIHRLILSPLQALPASTITLSEFLLRNGVGTSCCQRRSHRQVTTLQRRLPQRAKPNLSGSHRNRRPPSRCQSSPQQPALSLNPSCTVRTRPPQQPQVQLYRLHSPILCPTSASSTHPRELKITSNRSLATRSIHNFSVRCARRA